MVANIFTLFLAFSTALLATADVPVCNGIVTFNAPENYTVPVWYPTNFTKEPPLFPENYTCEYQINVSQGWYARVTLSVKTLTTLNGTVPVTVIGQLGRSEEVVNMDSEYFYFLSSGGKIKLSTESANVRFGFDVTWDYYTRSTPITLDVFKSDSQPSLLKVDTFHPIQVKAETRVSATMMAPAYYDERFLRGVVFFDGPDWNSTCLGNAKQLLDGNTQYVSTGNTMSILYIGWTRWRDFLRILLQDYELTKGISQFQSMYRFGFIDRATFTMDATKGPSAVQTYADNEMQTDDVITKMEGTGTLDVYIGAITENKTNLLTSYRVASNNTMNLPQMFLGQFKTFVLTEGVAEVTITRDYFECQQTNNFGRKGLISSGQYGTNSTYQTPHSEIDSPNRRASVAKFRYTVLKADLVGTVKLQVIGRKDSSTVFNKTYTHNHMPSFNGFYGFYGDEMHVVYDGTEKNTGFLMDFEVDKSSRGTGMAIGIIASLLVFLWKN